MSNFSIFVNTWQSRLIRSVPQLSWKWRRVLLLVYRQPGTNCKWPEAKGNRSKWSLSVCSNLANSGSRVCAARGTSPVSFPRPKGSAATCFLILLGPGRRQCPDFKVNAKGPWWGGGVQRPGSVGLLSAIQTAALALALALALVLALAGTQTMRWGRKETTSWTGRETCPGLAHSESPLHDYLRIAEHYLQACFQVLCGNGRRELGAAIPVLLF